MCSIPCTKVNLSFMHKPKKCTLDDLDSYICHLFLAPIHFCHSCDHFRVLYSMNTRSDSWCSYCVTRSDCVGLRTVAYWDRGFESRRGHGYLFVISFVCVVKFRSLLRADHSSRGVLSTVVWCVGLCMNDI
jgi:hypothetical protein